MLRQPTYDDIGTPTAAVIIPVHNEAAVIRRGLDALLRDARPNEFEVWVVVNGSSDKSAILAREVLGSTPGGVIELAAASKTGALRAGDAASTVALRIYLDADVVLSTAAARSLVTTLSELNVPAAASPRMRLDTGRSDRVVRGWCRVWSALPSIREGAVGSGVYAVNGLGRARLGDFPDVLNDDGWVRRSFSVGERHTVDAEFRAIAARTARALVARRARIAIGNAELDRLGVFPPTAELDEPAAPDRSAGLGAVRSAVKDGKASWADVACFLGVTAAARLIGGYRNVTGQGRTWSTDTTSRERVPS